MASDLEPHSKRVVVQQPSRARYEAVAEVAREAMIRGRADHLVKLAAELGDDPRAFYTQAASFLEQMVAEIANPRAKDSRAYKKAAAQFRKLACVNP